MASNSCLRCHRGLSDPDSVKRGFGPKCWSKVRGKQKTLDEIEPRTVTEPALAEATMREIFRRAVRTGYTCDCKKHVPIHKMDLLSCDHSGGHPLQGFGEPQWVWFECPDCGYQLAYWKLRGESLEDLAPGVTTGDNPSSPVRA